MPSSAESTEESLATISTTAHFSEYTLNSYLLCGGVRRSVEEAEEEEVEEDE